jgi:hypothetical protein
VRELHRFGNVARNGQASSSSTPRGDARKIFAGKFGSDPPPASEVRRWRQSRVIQGGEQARSRSSARRSASSANWGRILSATSRGWRRGRDRPPMPPAPIFSPRPSFWSHGARNRALEEKSGHSSASGGDLSRRSRRRIIGSFILAIGRGWRSTPGGTPAPPRATTWNSCHCPTASTTTSGNASCSTLRAALKPADRGGDRKLADGWRRARARIWSTSWPRWATHVQGLPPLPDGQRQSAQPAPVSLNFDSTVRFAFWPTEVEEENPEIGNTRRRRARQLSLPVALHVAEVSNSMAASCGAPATPFANTRSAAPTGIGRGRYRR